MKERLRALGLLRAAPGAAPFEQGTHAGLGARCGQLGLKFIEHLVGFVKLLAQAEAARNLGAQNSRVCALRLRQGQPKALFAGGRVGVVPQGIHIHGCQCRHRAGQQCQLECQPYYHFFRQGQAGVAPRHVLLPSVLSASPVTRQMRQSGITVAPRLS